MNDVEKRQPRPEKETIHSGHFMVSHFEAEAQDDFDDLVTVPDEEQNVQKVTTVATYTVSGAPKPYMPDKEESKQHQQLSIEISLTKLFKCMTLAYRQKLTSPKWNRFKGIKLRWKDKIRLNNVIWRCWHMQFIKKQNTLVCQFASPLDVDTHVKPEATILEGKYWKRRAEAVIAEYKKWRKFHIMRLLGKGDTSVQDTILDMDTVESFSQCSDLAGNMLTDEDYLNFMTDTLFSTITNHQPFAFPDCREIARGASLADFIQPSLGPLQPNLDDFMDTLEPLQDLLTPRLPPVPEESPLPAEDSMYRGGMAVESYTPHRFLTGSQSNTTATMPTSQMSLHGTNNNTQMMMAEQTIKNEQQMGMYVNGRIFAQSDLQNNMINAQDMCLPYQSISYEQQNTSQPDQQMHTNVYATTSPRSQYVNTPKIVSQSEPVYNKYNAGVPPSQTAPETVSLLQQPVQNSKYASTIVIQGRSGYSREKPRQRVSHYTSQVPQNNQYQSYGQAMSQAGPPVSPQGYESRSVSRQTSPQMQYLQPSPAESYKAKTSSTVNPRSFKMPSPPLVPAATPQLASGGAGGAGGGAVRNKEQFRSHSLPLGAQLNPDWSVSAPSQAQPLDAPDTKHTARARESNPGGIRIRSRSTSSGVAEDGQGGAGPASGAASGSASAARRPPPLNSVASEPTLPQASVMLAQLLSAQHSQSLYKLNSEEGTSTDPTRSPIRRAQPSPIGSDVMSPHQSLSPPTSPGGTSPRAGSPREPRRTHLHAEQKRRYNIKNGFDTLQALIPHLNTNPAAKISKAAMLQKGAEYIKQLKAERNQIKEEMESLRQQIECLNNSITNCHSLLPATGAPVSRARSGRLREMFARHVANRTMHNWKYWLFSVVSAALVESFSACVSCSSAADLVRTTLLWAEQHCSLVEMRPAVLNSLRVLCTTTDILTSPERLPEEARAAVAASAAVKAEPT
ncbi:carbohydrate-responsive element-binding protein isoform X2 [Trichoplusia ni]|uniref:Carbohydrate-responsive element-binding protein isoform X2 n=1 Tax=Trichoplusia ni TaxID=7111 RepID=A0A7E5WPF3_TRINI|nr:carbohydrate-responsive element-binding protein isoform X2 [Trichoplusia ni]